MTKKEKIDKAVEDLINKMFEIAGHSVTFADIKDRKDDWYCQWTMTTEQADEWQLWGIDYMRKNLKWPKYRAENEMRWFNLQYGLKYSNYEL